ncbi:MAG: short-chain dehydrogenase/reductase [Candidatus Saccharibacteria bacterium]|nr:short-chain dehydrogenase/reductase [Candidatus Saccharibacteria bacterium]
MIVITGASGGLGGELAKLFSEKNKKVVGLSRNPSQLEEVETIETDLTSPESIEAAAQKINQMDEKLEALINCAGVLSIEEIDKITAKELERVFSTNVTGPILLTSLLIDKIKRDGADIVNVASTVGTKAYENQAAYGASKWAVRGFSANLQVELKKFPCRVISFCPGGFKTKLFEKATGVDSTAEGSWMTAEDMARFMVQILELPKSMEVSEVIVNRK